MTADEFKKARTTFGMSAARFAEAFGIGSDRSVRRYEDGSNKVNGPLAILIRVALDSKQVRQLMGFTTKEVGSATSNEA